MKKIVKTDPRILAKDFDANNAAIIIHVNEFTEKAAKAFSDEFSKAHSLRQPIIPVVIDSYGGEVYSLLSMMTTIEQSEIPVATIAMGKAMSCGAVLLSCGKKGKRFMDSNSTIMIHDVSSMSWGKVEEVKSQAKETNRLNKLVYKKMAENCGQDENYFLDLIHEKSHADWHLDAEAAKKHKLVNHIRIPKLEIEVNLEIKFS